MTMLSPPGEVVVMGEESILTCHPEALPFSSSGHAKKEMNTYTLSEGKGKMERQKY